VRQAEVVHETDEVRFAVRGAEARVEGALLADAAREAPRVIVGGDRRRTRRQREQPVVHRSIEPMRVPLLEVGAPGAADHQRIAREHRVRSPVR
jgi:hypothetical protein